MRSLLITSILGRLKRRLTGEYKVWRAPAGYFADPDDVEAVFAQVYRDDMWGGGSGPGSAPAVVEPYLEYLADFLKAHHVRSIVDLGCGDWQHFELLDLTGIEYLGIDVVEDVIRRNQAEHGRANVRFRCMNVLEEGFASLPDADLLVVKDVLQHLSTPNVKLMLEGICSGKFRRALVTNDYGLKNVEIDNGCTRPLDLRRRPFSLARAKPVLSFIGKRTFLIE